MKDRIHEEEDQGIKFRWFMINVFPSFIGYGVPVEGMSQKHFQNILP